MSVRMLRSTFIISDYGAYSLHGIVLATGAIVQTLAPTLIFIIYGNTSARIVMEDGNRESYKVCTF